MHDRSKLIIFRTVFKLDAFYTFYIPFRGHMFWRKEPKTKFLVCIPKEKKILLFTQEIFL